MKDTYPLYFGSRVAGTVSVTRQGLYYLFDCCCQLPEDGIYAVWDVSVRNPKKIGVCIPNGREFALEKRIPTKEFSNTDWKFEIVSSRNICDSEFVLIDESKTFAYLDRLEYCTFDIRQGRAGMHVMK